MVGQLLTILLSGVEKNGLYELQHCHFPLGVLCGSSTAAFLPLYILLLVIITSQSSAYELWHRSNVVSKVLQNCNVSVTMNESTHFCAACHLGKSQIPFFFLLQPSMKLLSS